MFIFVSSSDLDSSWGDFADHFGVSCGTRGALWDNIGAILVLFNLNFEARSDQHVCAMASMRHPLFVHGFFIRNL